MANDTKIEKDPIDAMLGIGEPAPRTVPVETQPELPVTSAPIEQDTIDTMLGITTTTPAKAATPDNVWLGRAISDEKISQWATDTGISEDQIRDHIVVKGGILDLVNKVNSSGSPEELQKSFAVTTSQMFKELMLGKKSPDDIAHPSMDLANNILTIASNPAKWTKGRLSRAFYANYVMDQFSGTAQERMLKDKIDQELKHDMNILNMAIETVPSLLVGGPLTKAGIGAAKMAAAPAIAKIATLAERVGIPALPVAVSAVLSPVTKYAKLSAGIGVAAGAQSAALAPRGDKVEEGLKGFAMGAGIITAGAAAGATAKLGINMMGAANRGMTKMVDNFGERAAANISKRVPEEQKLFDVAHVGQSVLPDDINQLRDLAQKVGVNESTVIGLKSSPGFIRQLGIQPVGEEIAAKTRGVAERNAKLELLREVTTESIDPKRLKIERMLLDQMTTNKEIKLSPTKLAGYVEIFDLDDKLIRMQAKSADMKKRLNLNPNHSFASFPEETQGALINAARNDAVADYVTKLDIGKIKQQRQLLNLAEGRPTTESPDISALYESAKSFLHLPDHALRVRTNKILGGSRESIGAVVSKLSPESALAVDVAAYKRAIEIHAQREYVSFAQDHLPTFTGQRANKVNLPRLFENLDSKKGVTSALQEFDWIPAGIKTEVREMVDVGTWNLGAKRLAEWAGDVTRGRSLAKTNMTGLRASVDKAIHDAGNDLEQIKKYWMDHRFNREMQTEARIYRTANKVPTQELADSGFKYMMPSHITLDDISRRWGLELDLTNLRLNNAKEVAGQQAENLLTHAGDVGINSIKSAIRDGGVDPKLLYQVIEDPRVLNTIADGKMRGAVRDAAANWTKVGDFLLETAAENGKRIAKRENWIHHTTMDATNSLIAIRRELPDIERAVKSMNNVEFTKRLGTDTDFNDFAKSLEWVTHHKVDSTKAFNEAVAMLSDVGRVADNMSPQLAAAKSRSMTGGIPELIRERDLEKITAKYINQLMRSTHLNTGLGELHAAAKALDAIGNEGFKRATESAGKSTTKANMAGADAAYIREYMKKVAGFGGRGKLAESLIQPFVLKRVNRLAEKYRDDPVKLDQALNAPRYVGEIISNLIYSSTLHRPASFIKNLTQIPLITAEEINHADAIQMGVQAMSKGGWALTRMAAGEKFNDEIISGVIKRLQREGKIPRDKVGEMVTTVAAAQEAGGMVAGLKATGKHLSETYRDSGKLATAKDLSRLYADGMLVAFSKTEQINRIGTALLADDVIRNVKTGKWTADQAFGKISSPSVKKQLMKAAEGGKITEREAGVFEDYLLQKSQFVYNDAQKAQIIKDIGPIFGAFLRYGSEASGVVVGRIKSGQLGNLAESSVRQLTWLTLGNNYINGLGEKNEAFKARKESIIGKGALYKLSPVTGAVDYLSGGAIPLTDQPYSLKIVTNLLKAAKGDGKAMGDFTKTLIELTPGVALTETIIDDMYTKMLLGRDETNARDAVKAIGKGVAKGWKGLTDQDITDWFEVD